MNQYDPYNQPQYVPPVGSKGSAAMAVFSVIPFVLSVISVVSAGILYSIVSRSSNNMNEAALSVIGMIFFIAATWGFGLLGTLGGFVMTVLSLIKKRTKTVIFPVLGVVLGIAAVVIAGGCM